MASVKIPVTAILMAVLSFSEASAVCVDFDGGGRCIETGPARNVPMPAGPELVGPAPSSSDRESAAPEQAPAKKKPRTSVPSMKSVVTGTIVEGVLRGLTEAPPAKPGRPPVTTAPGGASPEALKIERDLEAQEDGAFHRAKGDLVGGLKGVEPTSRGITLKVPPPAPGAKAPSVGLLRDPSAVAGNVLLSPEEFRKAVMNPDLTQEERDRLFLRTQVAPTRLDDHPAVDARAFVEKERYSDVYLDIVSAGGKAAASTLSLSLVDEAGKRALKLSGKDDGYDELLTLGKGGVERPQTTAGKVVALGDYALTKAPAWSIAADAAANAAGAMSRQAVVRYWAARDSRQEYDPTPVKTSKESWNAWVAQQNDWTRAALDRVSAGEFR